MLSGFIAVVVGLGAMIGRFLEQSGGGRALADWLLLKFGKDRAAWALLVAGFLVGLPLFFEVGVVIMAPLVWSVAQETRRSLLYYALPTLSALTIVHSMVPPHPAPAAASQLFGADLGHTILYGIAISIPSGIVGGMFYGRWIAKRIHIDPPEFAALDKSGDGLPAPSIPMVVLLLLLPVLLIFGATVANLYMVPLRGAAVFLGPSLHRTGDHRPGRNLLLRPPPRRDARQAPAWRANRWPPWVRCSASWAAAAPSNR